MAPRATPPGPLRALAQLFPDAPRGDGPRRRGGPAPSPPVSLHAADALAARRAAVRAVAGDRPATAGRGSPDSACAAICRLSWDRPRRIVFGLAARALELWAFRAGIKPVAFLTVRPDEVERTLAYFGDAIRAPRAVRVGAQDRWTDRRDEGEVHVFTSPPTSAGAPRRPRQAEVDPTRALVELGTLVGYPPAAQRRLFAKTIAPTAAIGIILAARTRTDASTAAPWPWQPNNPTP
jgi:hypothetical protein